MRCPVLLPVRQGIPRRVCRGLRAAAKTPPTSACRPGVAPTGWSETASAAAVRELAAHLRNAVGLARRWPAGRAGGPQVPGGPKFGSDEPFRRRPLLIMTTTTCCHLLRLPGRAVAVLFFKVPLAGFLGMGSLIWDRLVYRASDMRLGCRHLGRISASLCCGGRV